MSTESDEPRRDYPIKRTGEGASVYHLRECCSVKKLEGFRNATENELKHLEPCKHCTGETDHYAGGSGRDTTPSFKPEKKPMLTECSYPDCSGDVQQGYTPSQQPQCRACGRRPDYVTASPRTEAKRS